MRTIVDLVLDVFLRRPGNRKSNSPVAWLILLAILGAGCTDATTGPGPTSEYARPTSITLSPSTFVVDEGDSIQMVPHFTGDQVAPNRVTWKIEPGYKASISTRGVVRGEISGAVTVTARYGELQATSDGAVRPIPAILEVISSDTLVGSVSATLPEKVSVRVLGKGGDPVPGVEVSFSVLTGSGSVTAGIVKTDLDGIARTTWVLGPRPGNQRLSASVPMIGTLTIEAKARAAESVEAVGGQGQSAWVSEPLRTALRVKVTDGAGNPVAGQPVSWSVTGGGGSIQAVGGFTTSAGIATARWTLGGAAGVQTVEAQVAGIDPVTFSARAEQLVLSALEVSKPTVALDALGDQVSVAAVARDNSGDPVEAVALNWKSLDPSIVRVDSMGSVTSVGVGATMVVVSAFCCSVADTVPVEVTQTPVGIRVSPATRLIEVGKQYWFAADVQDRNGFPISGSHQAWSSANPGIASVTSSTGKVEGRSPGSTSIAASLGDLSAQATVQVTESPLPSTYEPTFFDDFERGELAPSVAGYGHGSSNIKVSSDNSYSGKYSLKFVFGPDGPGEDSWAEHRFHFGEQLSAVWVEYQLFVPSNYYHRNDDGPDNNKFFRLWASGQKFSLTLNTLPERDAPGESMLQSFLSESGGTAAGTPRGDAHYIIGPRSPIRPGQWHQIRVHWHSSVDGTRHDGRAEVFVNGELVHSVDRDFWNQSGQSRTYVDHGYLLGWSNSGFSERTEFFIDDFKIFSADPGWD